MTKSKEIDQLRKKVFYLEFMQGRLILEMEKRIDKDVMQPHKDFYNNLVKHDIYSHKGKGLATKASTLLVYTFIFMSLAMSYKIKSKK